MNNHEIWVRCSTCRNFYDIRVDNVCPICLNYKFSKQLKKIENEKVKY